MELYVQGAIASLIVAGLVAVSLIQALNRQPFVVPDVLGWSSATVLGFFFGARAVRVGISSGSASSTQAAVSTAQAVEQARANGPKP